MLEDNQDQLRVLYQDGNFPNENCDIKNFTSDFSLAPPSQASNAMYQTARMPDNGMLDAWRETIKEETDDDEAQSNTNSNNRSPNRL